MADSILANAPTGDELLEQQRLFELTRWDNDPYTIDVSRDYPEQVFLFSRQGVGFAPLGDIQVIKAKQKNGKTRFVLHLMTAALGGEHIGTVCNVPGARVLYADTEQSVLSTVKVARGTLKAAGLDDMKQPSNFKVLNFRKAKTEERWARIRSEIYKWKPTLVIIDGVRDIVSSINDEEAATKLNEELMSIAEDSNASIWLIIHVNKNDSNPRGHVGTELQNKGSETWELKKEVEDGEKVFTATQCDARNPEVDAFKFMLDHSGIPILPITNPTETRAMALTFQGILGNMSMIKSEIAVPYMNETGVKKTKAYEDIGKALNLGIISPDPSIRGKYYFTGHQFCN